MDAKEKRLWIMIGVLTAAAIGYVVWSMYGAKPADGVPGPENVACTLEAKQCPDGSYVGRQGPNCEFAPCPGPAADVQIELR